MKTTPPARIRALSAWKIALLLGGALALLLAFGAPDIQALFRRALTMARTAGAAGALVLFALYIVLSLLMLPALFLTIAAGTLFGVFKGSVLALFGATTGASAAFLAGRHLARERINHRFGRNRTFRLVDEAVSAEGWKIVFLTRLSPAFPFNVQNYLYGISGVSFRDYVLASWTGMIPGTVMYTSIGALAADLANTVSGERTRTPLEWTVTAAGLAATVAATLLIARIARRALKKRIPSPEKTGEDEW